MQVNLNVCLYVLESKKNDNIRKNDIKEIKVLVDKNNILPSIKYNGNDLKEEIRKYLSNIINTNLFHLEQVYTNNNSKGIDIIYLAVTNSTNIKNLNNNYKLVDFKIENNKFITLDNKIYKYKTIEKETYNNIEYIHEIDEKDNNINNNLLNMLICYKKIRSNIDNTDIIFKFLGSSFTLEDVRIVYELIKECTVDKSNFRKKIIKYCSEIEEKEDNKNGYRPSKKYKFKPLKGDIWL